MHLPRLLSHLASAYCMYIALGVFAAVYEYTCPFTPLFRSFISLPPSLLPHLLGLFSTRFPPTPILADRQTNSSFFRSRVVSWCCLFSQLTAWTHTRRDTQKHKHVHTSPTLYTPRGVPLTQIRTHQSRPLWNDSGESQVNITARKGQTAINIHTHTLADSFCL